LSPRATETKLESDQMYIWIAIWYTIDDSTCQKITI
jgi:hypothetical protein